MNSLNALNDGKAKERRNLLHPFPFHRQIERTVMCRKMSRYGCVLLFLTLLFGCVHVPMSSETTVHEPLPSMQPLEPGETVVIYGENAPVPKESVLGPYFTAFCRATRQRNTIGELIRSILKLNPQPGRYAVRHLKDLETEGGSDCTAAEGDSILCRLNLPKARVEAGRLRYAIHVRETFEAKIHVPLYVPPIGIASCGNKTVLEATIWELPTERRIGAFAVSAEGEFTVLAYMLHIVVARDTQQDATQRLAREIVEKLTGLKPLNQSP